jgi:hypothetical protein
MSRTAVTLLALAALAGALLVGCGAEEVEPIPDKRIVRALGLVKSERGYAIAGDPFCEVARELLNDRDEVRAARNGKHRRLVVADADERVGLLGVPPFLGDCRKEAKRLLQRLAAKS